MLNDWLSRGHRCRSESENRHSYRLIVKMRSVFLTFGRVTMNFGALALFLGLLAIVTGRILGPSDRGIVVIFMTLSSMLWVLGSFGTNTFARVRLVAPEKPLLLADYLGLVYVLALLQVLLSLVFGAIVLHATHSFVDQYVLALLMVYSVLNLLSYLLRDGLYAYGHNAAASRADVIAAAAQLALVIGFWLCFGLTLQLALIAITTGQCFEVVYLKWRYRTFGLTPRPRWAVNSIVMQIRGGSPALVTSLSQTMIFRLDRLLLGLFATTAQVGLYSVAATMTEALLLIPASIAQVMFHRIASSTTRLHALARLRIASLSLCILSALVLGLAAPQLVTLLFGQAYISSVMPLRILLVGAIAMGSYLVDIACVNAMGRLANASMLTLAGLMLIAILDVALIPHYGMNGAAVASTFSYVVMAILAARQVRLLGRRRTLADLELDD